MIQQAIESLHYQVNTFARGLKTSRTQTVGFLMHHWESPFFLHIISIVEERLHEHGYSVMVCAYNGDEQQEKEKLQLLSTRCDALVVHPLFLTAAYLQEHLTRALPVISIDRPLPGYNCDNILINTSSAGYSAVESLVQRGHRHIALLTGTRGLYTSTARVRAYERVFEDYGLPINRELIPVSYTHLDVYKRQEPRRTIEKTAWGELSRAVFSIKGFRYIEMPPPVLLASGIWSQEKAFSNI